MNRSIERELPDENEIGDVPALNDSLSRQDPEGDWEVE
jgi:hypothetical protein